MSITFWTVVKVWLAWTLAPFLFLIGLLASYVIGYFIYNMYKGWRFKR